MEAAGGPELKGEQAGPPRLCRPASQVHVSPAPSLLWNVHPPPAPPHQGTGIWFPHSSPAQNNRDATPSPRRGCGQLEGPPRREWCCGPLSPRGLPLSLPPLPPPLLLLLLLLWARGTCRAAEQGASRVRRAAWRKETPAGSSEAEQDSRVRRTGRPAAPLLLGPLNGPFLWPVSEWEVGSAVRGPGPGAGRAGR